MPSIDSVILGLLQESSLPDLYKRIIRNMLPYMTQIQKEDIYLALSEAKDKRKALKEEGEKICRKYEDIVGRIETEPDNFLREVEEIEKECEEDKTKQSSGSARLTIKQKLALQSLKKEVKAE